VQSDFVVWLLLSLTLTGRELSLRANKKRKESEVKAGKAGLYALKDTRHVKNPSLDPFGFHGKKNLSPFPNKICEVFRVKNWDRLKMQKLRKAGCCLLWSMKGHSLKDCTDKVKLFNQEKLCFRPNI
jgi:hypothetical protein